MHVCSVSNVLKKEKEKNVGGTGKRRVAGGQPEMALHRGRKSGRKEVFSQHRPGRGFLLSSSTLSLSLSLLFLPRLHALARSHAHVSRFLLPWPWTWTHELASLCLSPLSAYPSLTLSSAKKIDATRRLLLYYTHAVRAPFLFLFQRDS